MKNQSSLPRWSSLVVLALAATLYCAFWAVAAQPVAKANGPSDLISIKSVPPGTKPEMPPAVFLHDKHTEFLAEAGKDCMACHVTQDGKPGLRFLEAAEQAPESLKDYYHTNCMGCHASSLASGAKAPQAGDCRSCHDAAAPRGAERYPFVFDKIIHNQHIQSAAIPAPEGSDTNCGACHTSYDTSGTRIDYVPGTEQSCRSCHQDNAEIAANAPSKMSGVPLKDTMHASCVGCHVQANQTAGASATAPVACADCHSKEVADKRSAAVADMQALKAVPRLAGSQPDAVVMVPVFEKSSLPQGGMGLVTFDHKLHEQYSKDCRSCHHKEISSCGTCHTVEGKAEGGFIPVSRALHESCIGCHTQVKARPECASCHNAMPNPMTPASCVTCHSTADASGKLLTAAKAKQMSPADLTKLAENELSRRAAAVSEVQVNLDDIPETVTIDVISNEYGPSVMPHRAIVENLLDKAKQSELANTFHMADPALCAGCHHVSPASTTPPKCVSCHSVSPTEGTGLPTLKAAYHLQCTSCHAAMEQPPLATDCSGCHKPLKK